MRGLVALVLVLVLPAQLWAMQTPDTPSGQQVPRFVSLKVDVANGRSGPSAQHPIAWRYTRAGLPMEVIAETPEWRRVRDPGGEVTWMHRSILSGRRSVFTLEETPLHARDNGESPVEAIAGAGVVLSLERCRTGWCRVEAQGYRGWVSTATLWGVYPDERSGEDAAGLDGTTALSAPRTRDTALR
ncbi:SH3 domain-containing protein [Maricaulis sp.]|uniref:SH3 domain-containing protein n=1 Tax=Maricaulis sp. TaxID=1486257 RepID=UPI0026118EC8|nr:SH3 domain-containing protein [Maricaulis sp.]